MSASWHQQRWVLVMCDLCADGVWDHRRVSCSAECLPIGEALVTRLRGWQVWYDQEALDDPDFDVAAFAAAGLAIARQMKRELGSEWTVIYHDEQRAAERPLGADRSYFEYEIGEEAPSSRDR